MNPQTENLLCEWAEFICLERSRNLSSIESRPQISFQIQETRDQPHHRATLSEVSVTSIGFQHDWDKIIDEFFDYTPLGTLVRKSILQTRKFGLRSKFLFHFFDGLSTLVQTEVTLDSFLDFEISRVSKTVDELSFDSPLPSTSFQMLLLCNTSPFHNSYPQFLGFCEILQSELDIILQINLSRQQPSLPPRTKMDLSSRICGRSSFVYESHSLSCGVYFSSVNHEDDILFFNRLPEDPFYRFRAYIQSIDPNKTWSKIVLESKLKFGPSLKEYLLSKSVMLVFQIHQLSNPSRNPQQTLSYLSSEPAPSKKILNCCVFNAMQKLLEASLSHSDSCPEAQSLEFGCFSDELNSPNEIKVLDEQLKNYFSSMAGAISGSDQFETELSSPKEKKEELPLPPSKGDIFSQQSCSQKSFYFRPTHSDYPAVRK